MKEKGGEAFTRNTLYHKTLQPKVKGEGKKRKIVGCARVRIRARVAKCTRRRAGALAYRYTPQVPKNSRELSGESRRFFLILSPLFSHREGEKCRAVEAWGTKNAHKSRAALVRCYKMGLLLSAAHVEHCAAKRSSSQERKARRAKKSGHIAAPIGASRPTRERR